MIFKFPYLEFQKRFYPITKVALSKGQEIINTEALVDSGAVTSLFQGSIGRELGLEIESGELRIFQGIGGKITGYVHAVIISIENVEFPGNVAFSDELTTSLNILGRESFFEKFIVKFNENKKIRARKWLIICPKQSQSAFN